MRIYIQIIAIVLFGFLLELFLPWYSVAIVAFVFGYLLDSESNFLGGLIGVALLWGIKVALISASASTDLASHVANIFPLKEKWILIAVTLVIGGLVGAFSCMTGALLKPARKEYY